MTSIPARARAFGRRTDISARSVLVTIFGDSIVPAGGEVWLGDLIDLAGRFGFSDRLVRTSMYRLTAEGWFDTERIGRRSRYRLTPYARSEFAEAESRIYHSARPPWNGRWTLAFLGLATLDREQRVSIEQHLAWRGFVGLASGVWALPGDGRSHLAELMERLGIEAKVPLATARFDDTDSLVDSRELASAFGLDEVTERYRWFIDTYRWASALSDEVLGGEEAFLTRTMIVHDLRRPVLMDPWLPPELHPTDWPGDEAHRLAATAYHHVDEIAWDWLAISAGLRPTAEDGLAASRFPIEVPG